MRESLIRASREGYSIADFQRATVLRAQRLFCIATRSSLLILFSACSLFAVSPEPDPVPLSRRNTATIQQRHQRTVTQEALIENARKSGCSLAWDDVLAVPNSIRGSDLSRKQTFSSGQGLSVARRGDHARDAIAVMDNLAGLFRITQADKEFRARKTHPDALGFHHVRLQQSYQGLPVVGGDVVVHFNKNDEVYEVNGRYVPDISLGIVPTIQATQAIAIAQADMATMSLPQGSVPDEPVLVVYARDGYSKLAYQLLVTYRDVKSGPGRWRYWIDAIDGSILKKFNDIQCIPAPSGSGSLSLVTGTILTGEGGMSTNVLAWYDTVRTNYYLTHTGLMWIVENVAASGYPDSNTYAHRGTSNWGTSDPAEMSTALNFDYTLKYYLQRHGLRSFDGAGAMARANVHEGTSYVNAYWDSSEFYFGDGDNVTARSLAVLDVCGHEFTHAVTEYSANLVYANESGALNESFSDIMGTCVEFFGQPDDRASYPVENPGRADWLLGEDSWLSSTTLRDMRDPANPVTVGSGNAQPTRYQGTYWDPYEEVHQNSGVQNFFFYLLCEGGAGTNDGINYSVTGIGITNAEQIAFRALTVYCTTDTDYRGARSAWLSAAMDLNPAWATSVGRAWDAVGVMSVILSPAGSASFSMLAGGTPQPSTVVYSITNSDVTSVNWGVSYTQSWIHLAPTSGSITGFGVQAVTVSLDSAVSTFTGGTYVANVMFSNSSSSAAESREVRLMVLPPVDPTDFFDDFDPDIDLSQWTDFGGSVGTTILATNYGGSLSSPNSLWFGSSSNRFITTRALDTSEGGPINFWLRFGSDVYPWENADLPDEGVILECSSNGGTNWTEIGRYDSSVFYSWTQVVSNMPLVAQGPAVLFRWRQLLHSGSDFDHWALDHVVINTVPPDDLLVTPGEGMSVSGYAGGPFAPTSQVYTLTNLGDSNLSWTARCVSNWVGVSLGSGVLAPGATTAVEVAINSNASALTAIGTYTASAIFSNVATGVAFSRSVSLGVLGDMAFSSSSYSVLESAGTALVTVVRYGHTNGAFGLVVATSNGTAMSGSDYVSTNATLSFAPGETSKTVGIRILSDSAAEGNETVNLTLRSPTGGGTLGSPTAGTLTIMDDDGTPVTLPLYLYDASTYQWDIMGDGSINDGTSDAYDTGVDLYGFPSYASGLLISGGREVTIGEYTNSGVAISRRIYVPTNQAYARFLEVYRNVGASVVTSTVSIDTDLGSDSSTVLVGTSDGDTSYETNDNWIVTDDTDGSGDPTLTHVVANDRGAGRPVTVAYTTGVLGYDYRLVLAPGETKMVLHIAAQSANRSTATNKAVQLTGLGMDVLTGLSAQEQSQIVNFGLPDPLTVTPSTGLTSSGFVGGPFSPTNQVYRLTNTGGSNVIWSTLAVSNWLSVFPAGGTLASGGTTDVAVVLRTNANALAVGSYAAPIVFSNNNSGVAVARIASLTVMGELSFSADTATATESGGASVFTVRRLGNTNRAITVQVGTSNGTALAGSDYVATNMTLSFALGETSKTFQVQLLDDVLTEATETLSIRLTNATGGSSLGVPSMTLLSIFDDDLFDDFDPAIDMAQWSAFGGSVGSTILATNYGGFVSAPNSLWFGATSNRYAATRSLDTSAGAALNFWLRFGNSTNPWENADLPGEGVVLESSTNGGVSWTEQGRYDTTNYYAWTYVATNLSATARGPDVRLRWRQLSNSGSSSDHWALDSVGIVLPFVVSPSASLVSTGYARGSFVPTSQVYRLHNLGASNVSWTAACPSNWVSVAPTAGVIAAGATADVAVVLRTNVQALRIGTYNATVTFSNQQTSGRLTRTVAVTMSEAPTQLMVVASSHGSPVPAKGTNYLVLGTQLVMSVNAVVDNGGTQYVNTGWTGTGDVPASGTGTNVNITVTRDSSIRWTWNTNYWLDLPSVTGGLVVPSSGWKLKGTNELIRGFAYPGYVFSHWSGVTGGCTIAGSQITVPMTNARRIQANFMLNVVIDRSPQTLAFTGQVYSTVAGKFITVSNSGTTNLNYTIASDRLWLNVLNPAGQLRAGMSTTHVVRVSTRGLTALRLYRGNLTISDPNATNNPQVVPVDLKMIPVATPSRVIAWGENNYSQTNVPLGLTNAIAVAGGVHHSLALQADGRVVAWGAGNDGQTNVPASLTNAIALVAGDEHSLALRADGTVTGWGRNSFGQLNVPTGLTDVVAIAGAYTHSVALRSNGTVVVWGLQYGATNVPSLLTNVVAVSAGSSHSLALRGDGTVVAWGYNADGETNVPAGLSDVIAIASGTYHAIALRSNGTVVAWGYNAWEQTDVPVGLTNVVAIAGGYAHSLALLADGTVVGWGLSDYVGGASTPPAGLRQVKGMAAGEYHALAVVPAQAFVVTSDQGSPYPARGTNWLIRGTTQGLEVDSVITMGGTQYVNTGWTGTGDVPTTGTTSSASINVTTDSSITWNWRTNYWLDLAYTGSGSLNRSNMWVLAGSNVVVRATPVGRQSFLGWTGETNGCIMGGQFLVAAMTAARNIDAAFTYSGIARSPAAMTFTGQVYSTLAGQILTVSNSGTGPLDYSISSDMFWLSVSNPIGNLSAGQSTTHVVNVATRGLDQLRTYTGHLTINDPAATNNLRQVAISLSLAPVVTPSKIVGWGSSGNGELSPPGDLTNAVAIAAGWNDSIALRNDGTLVAWGYNGYGQTTVPAGLTNVVTVAAGYFHNLALKSDGTVVVWGYGSGGVTNVPLDLSNVVAIAGGWDDSVAVRRDGRVIAWGQNSFGETNVPADLTNAVAVASGYGHVIALRADGTVVAWGRNTEGQTNVPSGLTNAVAVAAQYDSCQVLRADGTVIAWGEDSEGYQAVSPRWLTNAVALAGKGNHTLALMDDRTVAAWGDIEYDQTDVPAGLTNVVSVEGGAYHSLALVPAQTLIVSSSHGDLEPPELGIGTHWLIRGVSYDLSWDTPLYYGGGTQYVNTGWVGTGDVPASGSSNTLGITLTQDSTITWTWRTNYWLDLVANNGTLNVSSGWRSRDEVVFVTVTNLPGYRFGGWYGETNGCTINGADITIPMNAARSIRAVFDTPLSSFSASSLLFGSQIYSMIPEQTLVVSNAGVVPLHYTLASDRFWLSVSNPAGDLAIGQATSHVVRVDTRGLPARTYAGHLTVLDPLAIAGPAHVDVSLTLRPPNPPNQVQAWGDNTYKQTKIPAALSNAIAISAGAYHSVALRSDGRVVAWGDNDSGQTNHPASLSNVIAVAAGWNHSLALLDTGVIIPWGDNGEGQTNIPPGLNAIAVDAGRHFSTALRADGSVICWGRAQEGESNVPPDLTNAVLIASGRYHVMALRANGQLTLWGHNDHGQLNIPVGLTQVVSVAAGGDHSLALRPDGTVIGWGRNTEGQVTIPAALSNVVAIAAGMNHSMALTFDGRVWAWGDRTSGRTNVPPGMAKAFGIGAGRDHSMALLGLAVPDDNAIPDWWLFAHGLTNGASAELVEDRDGDGMTTWDEYVADRDPANAGSVFQVASVSQAPIWSVTFLSSTGRVYTLEISTSIVTPAWTPVSGQAHIMGTGTNLTLMNTDPPIEHHYYRVRVDLP